MTMQRDSERERDRERKAKLFTRIYRRLLQWRVRGIRIKKKYIYK